MQSPARSSCVQRAVLLNITSNSALSGDRNNECSRQESKPREGTFPAGISTEPSLPLSALSSRLTSGLLGFTVFGCSCPPNTTHSAKTSSPPPCLCSRTFTQDRFVCGELNARICTSADKWSGRNSFSGCADAQISQRWP